MFDKDEFMAEKIAVLGIEMLLVRVQILKHVANLSLTQKDLITNMVYNIRNCGT